MIELKGICHRYIDGGNDVTILNNFSEKIEDSSFTVVAGPSGCGKTTLLNIMGGLLKPTSGSVMIDGTDYYNMSRSDRSDFRSSNIGYVFQDFYLVEDFSLVDNVLLAMHNMKESKKHKSEIACGLLSELGLKERLKWKVPNLSGGERQRIAIARALANDRKFILCDEPTGSLDEKSADEIVDILLGLKAKGKSVIVVTHNTKYIRYADKVIDFSARIKGQV